MDAQIPSSEKEPLPKQPETANAIDKKPEEDQKTNQQDIAGSELSAPPKSSRVVGRTPRHECRTPPNKVRFSSRTPPGAPRAQRITLRDDSWYGRNWSSQNLSSGRRPMAGIKLTMVQDQEAQQKLLEFDPFEELRAKSLKRMREESESPTPQGTKNDQVL
ncbi:uncharacterized protein N7483_004997 [Penicillium malachiteum]|uniref:uncharacterized protein n=1 Tax=Penicillium malachiteum TaxID=1324776 RepID=UPI0025495240|nr:uncharacterized protein N7483_004997 [Penicillium malachiteum]KAJ5730489.1 hypothetical protein N7483_004997 [Penicillium malachiteum]